MEHKDYVLRIYDRWRHIELGIVWEVTEKGAIVVESGKTYHLPGYTISYSPSFKHDLSRWQYLGNFGKTGNFIRLYEKLQGG